MKLKTVCLILITVSAIVWATWSIAYQRGYSQGSRDEFHCWKQVPTSDPDLDLITAQREKGMFPGGKRFPAPQARIKNTGARNVITSSYISQ